MQQRRERDVLRLRRHAAVHGRDELPDGDHDHRAPVQRSGGGFTITTNGTCFTGLTFAITDAAGRTLLTPPTASNVFGTAAPRRRRCPQPASPMLHGQRRITTFDVLVTGGTGTFSRHVSTRQRRGGSSANRWAPAARHHPHRRRVAGAISRLTVARGSQIKDGEQSASVVSCKRMQNGAYGRRFSSRNVEIRHATTGVDAIV